eukprot:TRINITY_DN10633_c0_g2_i1.p1 TRINITY_DN10633_c0_g2~~TRINITY_DN10633_c0_g2_i1.p1  ORF type:complete len:726 (+),score=94.64 TRINITY_DN10633_c0_g2_i1:49-2226(+)
MINNSIFLALFIFWLFILLLNGCFCQASLFEALICIHSKTPSRKLQVWQLLNYMIFFPLHLLRGLKSSTGLTQNASESEVKYLRDNESVHNDTLINFLVIRRSGMTVAFVWAMLGATSYIRMTLVPGPTHESQLLGPEGKPINIKEYLLVYHPGKTWEVTDVAAWSAYSAFFLDGIVTSLQNQISVRNTVANIVMALSRVIVSSLLFMALTSWSKFYKSKRYVLIAWFVAIFFPFIGTLLPVRWLIDWKAIDLLMDTYGMELSRHLGDASVDKAEGILESCESFSATVRNGGDPASIKANMKTTCYWVSWIKRGHYECCSRIGHPYFKVDFSALLDACKLAETEHVGDAYHMLDVACQKVVIPSSKKYLRLAFGGGPKYGTMIQPAIDTLKVNAEFTVGLMQGIQDFLSLLPTVISIGSAIIKGAMKTKLVAPQSTIPGMLLVFVPLIIAPLNWIQYSLIAQAVADKWLFAALATFAMAPAFTAIHSRCRRITKPLTDEAIAQWSFEEMIIMILYLIVLVVCLVIFVMSNKHLKALIDYISGNIGLVAGIFKSVLVSSLATTLWDVLCNLIFTSVSSCDFMLQEIGEQHHFEVLLGISEEMVGLEANLDEGESVMNWPKGLQTQKEREALRLVASQRRDRLDCIAWLLYREMPRSVEEDVDACVPGEHLDHEGETLSVPAVFGGNPLNEVHSDWHLRQRRSSIRPWPSSFRVLQPDQDTFVDQGL